ncbi:MAG: hypothetical protein OXN89_21190 [Bryobacterales bacterium]|nr:hypothetical protein [Bryobacterales bacterium]
MLGGGQEGIAVFATETVEDSPIALRQVRIRCAWHNEERRFDDSIRGRDYLGFLW